LNVGDVVSEV